MSEIDAALAVGADEVHAEEVQYGADYQAPPEDPITPPGRWIKENLFSSVGNTIQTIVFSLLIAGVLRWVLGLIFAEESDWTAVATNIRLLIAYNYPAEQFVRIWFTAGALFAAAGLSITAWHLGVAVTVRKLATGAVGFGSFLLLCGVLTPSTAPGSIRLGMIIIGLVILAGGFAGMFAVTDPHKKYVSFETLLLTAAGLVIAFVWLFPLGRYEFFEGEVVDASGTVNVSTKVPWTVMMLVLVGSYFLGKILARFIPERSLRTAMVVWWIIGPAFLIFLVLRDPAFDWSYVWRVDVPMSLGFAIGGGALLYWLTDPDRSELARVVGAALLAFALFNFIAAFFGWYPMLQKARISFLLLALFAIMAPTFAGEKSIRLRYAGGWAVLVFTSHWLITGINTPATLDIVAPPFLGGFVLTLGIAYYVVLASFPLGIILALARTSKMPIFRVMSTTYIEFVRGIPLITVLFFFSIMLPLFLPGGMDISELAAIFVGYSLFSGAYMAENIRGGLQSIRQGQYEASDALGLTTAQRTMFIVLPQALRVSIPNLVGQAIATFKETSLIAIVGGFDLLRVANATIPSQPEFLGQNRPALLFISIVYWVVAYSMSRASRNLEVRLGVGQGR